MLNNNFTFNPIYVILIINMNINQEQLQIDPTRYYIAPREEDKRRSKGPRKTFEVNEMWELHHEIVRRIVIGQTNRDIARSLGVSEPMVSYTRNSKVCQDKIKEMRAVRDADTIDLMEDIRMKAPKALGLLEDIIDDHGESFPMGLAAKTAENWLDRAGYPAVRRVEAAVVHLTPEEIKKIKEEAMRDARISGMVVDVGEGEKVKK